ALEAAVDITASGQTYELLSGYGDDLRYIFIVSQVSLTPAETGEVSIKVRRAAGQKCERCWNYSTRVGESSRYPTVCERCVGALEEIEAG
ncbi:MAG: zinc finger domain-containing protein, partial [Limisphaerales bacterium]